MAPRTETRWEESDNRLHEEKELTPTEARQGNWGSRILTILVVALVLAFILWIPVEIWGEHESDQVAPQQPGQELQSEQPQPAPPPSMQNGGAVPTEPTPPTQPPAPTQQ